LSVALAIFSAHPPLIFLLIRHNFISGPKTFIPGVLKPVFIRRTNETKQKNGVNAQQKGDRHRLNLLRLGITIEGSVKLSEFY